jgi:deazaflavin-dependent oxidoreductase (nitroreductase family)
VGAGLGVVIHRGRTSGRIFQTPLWAFRRGGGFVIALTYGSHSDWVRNVEAAGGCELRAGGRRYVVVNPRVYRDEAASDMPAPIRFVLRRVLKAPEFLRVDVISELAPADSRRADSAHGEDSRAGTLARPG